MSKGRSTQHQGPPRATVPDRPIAQEISRFHSTESRVGKIIDGRYRLDRMLGEGGMGIVYQAYDIKEKRKVAIKFLHESEKKSGEERFLREARAIMKVNHRNVVEISDVGLFENGLYVVMEYLGGRDLAGALRGNKRLDWKIAKTILLQVCDAVQAAHEKGIIHRDLKPANIFLVKKDGELVVKVLDFGLAKFTVTEEEETELTKTGFFLGTPTYASPEQARGDKNYDHRIDIYSLGVIMYEMLCGAVPFKGDTQLKTLLMHRDAPPIPPSRRMGGPDISMGVEAIVLKALAKKPENRFQTMERMRIAIENDGKATNLDDVRLGEAFAAMSRTGGYEESDVGYSYTEQTTPILKKSRRGMKTVGILLASAVVACGAYFHEPILQKMRELVDTYIGQEEREQVPYQIRIETEPGGADVYIEEEIAGANRLRLLGNTPISQRMPVGEHTLIIRKRRYEDARIVVSSENNEHQIELQRR